jgi:predicted RNase H-like HicB family nuclease
MPKLEYPVIIEPLSDDESGGFVALVPDLPGCMSDGDTAEAALASVQNAVAEWIDEAKLLRRPIPPPSRHLVAAE